MVILYRCLEPQAPLTRTFLDMDEKIKALVEIVDKLESRLNVYATYYQVIVIAIVGWVITSKMTFTVIQAAAVTLGVLSFLIVNFYFLRAATKRVVAAESELNALARKTEFESPLWKKELSYPSIPNRLSSTYIMHISIDILVIFVLWSRVT